MNRIAGMETEYGCLALEETGQSQADSWPARIRNHLFRKARAGAIDLHYRDYEEPPGNGGFLLNGGRLYVDMGHLEYASPECRTVHDIVAYDLAGDRLVQSAVAALKAEGRVAFIKNNIDHQTGATFGCHENYLMRREAQFSPPLLGALLAFLATRQVFTGAGRVGQTNPLSFEFEAAQPKTVAFQLSQRADHIVNDIYQWVQFNRAIINARDEPLADHRRYRRLHLLIGDSNISPYATALKIGTTSLVLSLLEQGCLPPGVTLADAVATTRELSRQGTGRGEVKLENGRYTDALDLQHLFLERCRREFAGADEESDWVLENWAFVLEALAEDPLRLIGGVDWVSKRWLLEVFCEAEGVEWGNPWLQSLDLEYHQLDPARSLFQSLRPTEPRIVEWNARFATDEPLMTPPRDTRAAGRGAAVARFLKEECSYLINWDSLAIEGRPPLAMPDPLETYRDRVRRFLKGV